MKKTIDNTEALKIAGHETKCSGSSNERSIPQKKHWSRNKKVPLDLVAIDSDSSTCSTSGLSSSSETSSLLSSPSTTTSPNRLKNHHNKQKKQQTNQSSRKDNHKQRRIQKRPLHRTTKRSTTTHKATDQYVALDCEMVGVGQDGKTSALARVTIIDWDGKILLDEYVKPDSEVTDYRTFVSGITKEHLVHYATLDLLQCRQIVSKLLRNKVLIGHALENDLRALGIDHPWYQIRDTAKYESFMKVRFHDGVLWPRKLKDLSRERLCREIQVIGKPHSPFEDALAALDLYKLVQKPWEKVMEYKIKMAVESEQQLQYLYHMQKQWERYNVNNNSTNNYNYRYYYTTENVYNNNCTRQQQPLRVGYGTPINHPPHVPKNVHGDKMYFQSAQPTY